MKEGADVGPCVHKGGTRCANGLPLRPGAPPAGWGAVSPPETRVLRGRELGGLDPGGGRRPPHPRTRGST